MTLASSRAAPARAALAASAVAASVFALGVLLAPAEAEAYCRTSACPGDVVGETCNPAQVSDCGMPLFWASRCVGYSLQQDASPEENIDLATATRIVDAAFEQWTTATCPGGGGADIQVKNVGPVECDVQQYNQKDGNQNAVIFRDDAWPYAGGSNTLAITTVTYNLDTGEIFDADMEINSADIDLTTGDGPVKFDLASIVTHEAGHFLGLSHSATKAATMLADYTEGTTFLRTLHEDDVAGICAAYSPHTKATATCDFVARHGFITTCSSDLLPPDKGGCCTVAAGGGASDHASSAMLATVVGFAFLAARVRSRRRAHARARAR